MRVSTKTFQRGCKKRIQLVKTLCRFVGFMNRKYLTLILKMKLIETNLVLCTGKFNYGHFQNMKAYI